MSIIGTNAAQSAAGVQQAEKAEARDKRVDPQKRRPPRTGDEYDTYVKNAETPEAVRNLAGNDQEQAREDRQEHPPAPHYLPDGTLARAGKPKRLDLKG